MEESSGMEKSTEERQIQFNEIDHSKEYLYDAIGITLEELEKYEKEVSNDSTETLMMKLGFTEKEIIEALEETQTLSEIIVLLWEARGKKEVSVKKYIATAVLIAKMGRKIEKEKIRAFLSSLPERTQTMQVIKVDIDEKKAIELIKSHGTEIWAGNQKCKEWKKKHGSSKGCPSELGCHKLLLIIHTVEMANMWNPTSFQDFLERDMWIKTTIKQILEAKNLKTLDKISASMP